MKILSAFIGIALGATAAAILAFSLGGVTP